MVSYIAQVEAQNEELRQKLADAEKSLAYKEEKIRELGDKLYVYESDTVREAGQDKAKYRPKSQTYVVTVASKDGYEDLRDIMKDEKIRQSKLIIPCLFYNKFTGEWGLGVSIRNK